MPFISKSTGIPTVDKVFKEVFAILNRFQGGKVASSSDEPVDWADIVNKPTTFPPESHTQDISTINNLQTALDSKEPVIALGTGNKYLFRDKTWKEVDWSEIINKPSTYSPTSHIHAIADITGLQTALDDKQPVHANLTSISNLSTTPSGRFLVTNGSAIVARPLQNSDLPAIAITDTFVVSSQAAMLALSAAERGDVAVRTDLNKSFILKGDNPASLSDWQELLTSTDAVLSVDGRTGVVSLSDKYQPLDTDLTTIAGLTHSNRHVMVSNGSSWTRRALEEADLPSLSISKITGLQSVLDGKSNTGHSHAWSEITSKPSTFTPSAHTHPWSGITDKPSTFTPSAHTLVSHTDWSTYFNQALKTTNTPTFAGGNFTGQVNTNNINNTGFLQNTGYIASIHPSNSSVYYRDVYQYRTNTASIAGTMKFTLPKSWSNTMLIFTIKGYNYNYIGAWECIISGYNYTNGWYNCSAEIRGSAPFSEVRLAHDGTKCCLLLGTPNTIWSIPQVAITEVFASYSNTTGWGEPYSMEFITGEDGITNIVTPLVNSGVSADWNALINKPSSFTPAAHTHPWSGITDKPSTFTPAAHGLVSSTHTVSGLTAGHVLKALSATTYGFGAIAWSEIASKPSAFTPSAHTHLWSEITDKPSSFTPSAHTHPWSEITGKPSTYAPASHGLVSSTHTVSGLTAGHVLKALSATSFGFGALTPSEIGAPAIGPERSLSITTAGWVTIATCNTGRAYGEFHVYDPTSARHNFTKIIASTSYGVNSVSVIGGNRFSTRTIAHVRILYNTSDRIYGGAKLQVYCENPTFTLYVKQFLSQEFTNWKAWNNVTPVAEGTPTGWAQDDSTYLQDITNPNYSFIGNVFSGKGLLLSGNATIIGNSETRGYSLFKNFTEHWEDVYLHKGIQLLNKAGNNWLSFVTRDVSGSEAKFNLSNIGSIDGIGPITLSDGGGGYLQLYNNTGQGLAKLKAINNNMHFTVETSTLPEVAAITIDRDAGSLGAGIPKVDINAVTSMNEKVYIQSDVDVSHNSLVRLSGAVRYNYIHLIGSVPTIDTDNYPGIYLIPSNPHNYTLTGGAPDQRIFVGNRSTHVQQVEGYRIEPGQFRDFLKTGTGWIASGASISGKTINVIHGTGNISVSNVSTVHINYSPTSTYTLTDGYVGQRVTVVVLSGSAQHWIQGASRVHKIVDGEFRDFIYTTDGWVASAADY